MKPSWSLIVFVGCLLIGFAASACKEDSTPTDPDKPYILDTTLTLYPLTVGDVVSFREDSLSSDGSVRRSRSYGPYSVTQSKVVGTDTWYFTRDWNGWLWNGAGGVWMKFDSPFDTTRSLMWKWPCKKGDTWTTRYAAAALDVQVTVEAVDRIITTPVRSDTCIVYTYRSGGQTVSVMYLAPGFGILLEDDYFTRSSMQTSGANLLPLVSYPRYRYVQTSVSRAGVVP